MKSSSFVYFKVIVFLVPGKGQEEAKGRTREEKVMILSLIGLCLI